MDVARLAEIDAVFRRLRSLDDDPDQDWDYGEWEALDAAMRHAQQELIAEVRRLKNPADSLEYQVESR